MKENVHPSAAAASFQQEVTTGEEVKVAERSSSSSSGGKGPSLSPSRIPIPTKVVERKPLTPVQPLRKKSNTIKSKMVGETAVLASSPAKKLGGPSSTRIKSPSSPMAKTSAPTCTSTPIISSKRRSTAVVVHKDNETPAKVFQDKEVQTDHPDLALITGDEAPPDYWKALAETRLVALEEALTENEMLHTKVEELERENNIMEEMLEHAKSLTEMISSMSEEDSGIATADESMRSVNQSQIDGTSTTSASTATKSADPEKTESE